MKRKILIGIFCFVSVSPVFALSKRFTIDISKFSISSNSKKNAVTSEFNNIYELTYENSSSNESLKDEITTLSKKVTYLLLGEVNNDNESSEEYFERRQDYLDLRYNPIVPKDPNSESGLDENSQEYKDDIVSGLSVPGMFNILDELNINYNSIGSVRITLNDNMIISMVSLPDVSMKKENFDNPMNYVTEKTNLVMYYYFKKLNDDYKLYYLFCETTDDLDDFFEDIGSSEEVKAISISINNDSKLNDVYDFSKLDLLTENKINEIYNNNYKNVLILNAYYNNDLVISSNGFFINDGLVVTTWSFLEKALIDSQYFVVKNSDGVIYDIDGIVTANPENDIAVIKLKDKIQSTTNLGNIDNMEVEDPVISISSKTGVSLTIQKGIITSKDGYIQSSLSLQEVDAGSPLYNNEGYVIGMNTSKTVNTSVSIAINEKVLSEIKNKFSNIDFSTIDVVSFTDLKEKYYYVRYSNESVINTIPSSKWKEFKKIGNIDNNINMNLTKASYDNNTVSLRYHNEISKYVSGMQLASSYKDELIKTGFEQILSTSTKCIYTNHKYKVIIMDEFDYLIVVMVKL